MSGRNTKNMKVDYKNLRRFYNFQDTCVPLIEQLVKAGVDIRVTRGKTNENGTYSGHLYSRAMDCDFPLYDTRQLEELLTEWLEMQESEA